MGVHGFKRLLPPCTKKFASHFSLYFLGIAVAAGITFTQTPIYQSNVQLFVSTPASALDISGLAQGNSFTQQRVISYAQIINGPATLNPVIKQLKLPYTEQELARNISSKAPLNTVLINLTVSDPDPERASAIANAVGAQFDPRCKL